jgi:hypothetical protein
MSGINVHDKKHAIERLNYVKQLDYTDKQYKKNLRKHMFKYKTKANGLLIQRLTAEQELFMFETYGYENLKNYAIDVLEQNIEYCTVLEEETHAQQINKTIEFLEKSNTREYLSSLKAFAIKTAYNWYIPVDRLINWMDCFMIQREVFFEYASNEKTYLFAPNYFTDNVLLLVVETDNIDEDYDSDLDVICEVYNEVVKGISNILRDLPEDRMIENLFTITDEEKAKNGELISQLAKDYYDFIDETSEDEKDSLNE